ncbi:Hint domain-containing protein [Tabrizicola sp.]|uniref:Hint domain-containing protein n=1 Tax=Tabrizicola sp. TaxID=2005166 RepID=UPI002733F8B2|nr:Hint domain-containing protein [Tabrizicola sp.]MDP3194712.1 Hint domain-containing protein [Tabrizicola sp.]
MGRTPRPPFAWLSQDELVRGSGSDMATLHDFIEIASVSPNTTYSFDNGNLLGVVDNVSGQSLDDGEFDIGDTIQIAGVVYRIDAIREPDSTGSFTLGDGTTRTFVPGSESNLDVVFLTVSSGGTVRHFAVPNDKYGAIDVQSIKTGALTNVAGSDAAIISTRNDQVNTVCFTRGTLLCTEQGLRPIETLQAGDLVWTADHGLRPVLWVGSRSLTRAELAAEARLRPIRVSPGAFGSGMPATDITLSPQHRVLVRSRIAERMLGAEEVLVAVRHLLDLPGIDMVLPDAGAEYFHLLFDRHEIVTANGLPCESLFLGPQALLGLAPGARTEVLTLTSRPGAHCGLPTPARQLVTGREGRKLAERHGRNRKPLIEPVAVAELSLSHAA